MTIIHNVNRMKPRRTELRSKMTPAEATLWKHLQRARAAGKKFRRQHSIGPYILDFYCPECRLAVELDGDGHFLQTGAEKDEVRTAYLKTKNVGVLRFENKQIFEDLEFVLEEIKTNLNTTPAPGGATPPKIGGE